MGGGSGGGGRGGREGGGGSPPANKYAGLSKAEKDAIIAESYRKAGMTPPGEMTKAEREAANTRNLAFSYESEGNLRQFSGRLVEPPGGWPKKVATPKPAPTKIKTAFDEGHKVGDIVTGAKGMTYRVNKYGGYEKI